MKFRYLVKIGRRQHYSCLCIVDSMRTLLHYIIPGKIIEVLTLFYTDTQSLHFSTGNNLDIANKAPC